MPLFQYKAAAASGEVIEGRMEAVDGEAVVRRLQADGHIPIRAEPVAEGRSVARRTPRALFERRRVTRRDVELTTVELATLLESGLTLDRALAIMTELATRAPVRTLLEAVREQVRGGADLSAAIAEHGDAFPPFFVSMVRAGEASGDLAGAVRRLATFLDRARTLRESLVSALLYPVILLGVAGLSVAVILGVVVPRISEMFADAGEALPMATRVVVALGAAVESYWWVGAIAGVGLWLWLRRLQANPAARLRIDRALLAVPIGGEIIAKLEASRFTRALGTLLRNGVPLVQALGIARQVVGNSWVAAALEAMTPEVEAGQGLSGPLVRAAVFPRLAAHLVRVGEEAGDMEGMLLRLADIYDVEVHSTVGRFVAVLGPLVILAMGLVIAGLILSILSALLSINELAF